MLDSSMSFIDRIYAADDWDKYDGDSKCVVT